MTQPDTGSTGPQSYVGEIPDGAKGFDCLQSLTADECAAMVRDGFVFAGRYLETLSLGEVATILRSGLGLVLIGESAAVDWKPSAPAGVARGQAMVTRARALGIPQGMALVIDYEGPWQSATGTDCTAWITNCAAEIDHGGFAASLYVGWRPILTPAQLAALPGIPRYWSAYPTGHDLPCGYTMRQQQPDNQRINGVLVDVDRAQADAHAPPRCPLALWGSQRQVSA